MMDGTTARNISKAVSNVKLGGSRGNRGLRVAVLLTDLFATATLVMGGVVGIYKFTHELLGKNR